VNTVSSSCTTTRQCTPSRSSIGGSNSANANRFGQVAKELQPREVGCEVAVGADAGAVPRSVHPLSGNVWRHAQGPPILLGGNNGRRPSTIRGVLHNGKGHLP
jgi:hypothetical protein